MPYPQAKAIDQNPALCPASPRQLDIDMRIILSTPKLEFPLILGETDQRFRASGGEGHLSDLMADKADCLKHHKVSLDTASEGSRFHR